MTPSTQDHLSDHNPGGPQEANQIHKQGSEAVASFATLQASTDPAMQSMLHCDGHCSTVPNAVLNAVYLVLDNPNSIALPTRESRTPLIAQRMAVEGWRFCPCFPEAKSAGHQLIDALVNTTVANKQADNIAHEAQTRQAQTGDRARASASAA